MSEQDIVKPTYHYLKHVLEEIMVPTNFISIEAVRSYVGEVLETIKELEPKFAQEYIFGLVEEEDEYGPGNLWLVYVSDKKTWTERKHMSDEFFEELDDAMRKIDFHASMENVYREPYEGEKKPHVEVMQLMQDIGLQFNEEFEDFVQP
tara:strand:- start:564 stop:1010 length:447 start_codon:yes stop_codon:yes gene_type:complete